MIPVAPVAEPPDFDEKVRKPGQALLAARIGAVPGSRRKVVATTVNAIPPDWLEPYWRLAIPDLKRAYRRTCAYLGMRIHVGTGSATVDHFIPKLVSPECPFVAFELERQGRL